MNGENYLPEMKKLGFGLMRLPEKDGAIDIEQTKRMVDEYMSAGFTYFDTAYVYGENGESEKVASEALTSRYPRDSFYLASKLPIWCCNEASDIERIFNTSLERCSTEYFDFYLQHALDRGKAQRLDELGAWEFAARKKREGKIRHIGFSFHDSAQFLDELLTKHPEQEFVQLQINYSDWESESVQSRLCYEVARKHNKPIIVMEPVRGGSLAVLTEEIRELFFKERSDMSVASWAVRFAASLDGVLTVLSGMSNLEQLRDNISYMKSFEPLSDREQAVVKSAADILAKTPTVPCTGCKYCLDSCPTGIAIERFISVYNKRRVYGDFERTLSQYEKLCGESASPLDCVGCAACEKVCPQHIKISSVMKQISAEFNG